MGTKSHLLFLALDMRSVFFQNTWTNFSFHFQTGNKIHESSRYRPLNATSSAGDFEGFSLLPRSWGPFCTFGTLQAPPTTWRIWRKLLEKRDKCLFDRKCQHSKNLWVTFNQLCFAGSYSFSASIMLSSFRKGWVGASLSNDKAKWNCFTFIISIHFIITSYHRMFSMFFPLASTNFTSAMVRFAALRAFSMGLESVSNMSSSTTQPPPSSFPKQRTHEELKSLG